MHGQSVPSELDALILKIADGQVEAFRRLYDIEASRMLGISIRILKRRALAEEAVHDAFLSLWKHAGSYNPEFAQPQAWLHTIVRNRALNILRGESRTDLKATIDDFDAISEEETPEEAVARLSDADVLKACLEKLEPRPRHAIVLAYVQGLTHTDIADRLATPLGTIKSQIRRALVTLKECMA
jgi:RNA polymerase sigma factor (sigma-70 family)